MTSKEIDSLVDGVRHNNNSFDILWFIQVTLVLLFIVPIPIIIVAFIAMLFFPEITVCIISDFILSIDAARIYFLVSVCIALYAQELYTASKIVGLFIAYYIGYLLMKISGIEFSITDPTIFVGAIIFLVFSIVTNRYRHYLYDKAYKLGKQLKINYTYNKLR